MSERLKFMGRLEEIRLQAEQTKLRMEGLVESIRNILDPFETNRRPQFIRADMAATQAVELAAIQIGYRGMIEEMAAIRKELGT